MLAVEVNGTIDERFPRSWRRLQIVLFVAAAIVLWWSGSILRNTGAGVRVAKFVTGYDGCMCTRLRRPLSRRFVRSLE